MKEAPDRIEEAPGRMEDEAPDILDVDGGNLLLVGTFLVDIVWSFYCET